MKENFNEDQLSKVAGIKTEIKTIEGEILDLLKEVTA